jgi:hypothetical protein
VAEHHRLGRCGGVQDCFRIAHPTFEGGQVVERSGIGEPDPSHVEQDQAGETGQAIEEVGDQRVVPLALQVVPPPGDEDQVGRAVARDLVRDVRTIVGSCVMGARRRDDAAILPDPCPPGSCPRRSA